MGEFDTSVGPLLLGIILNTYLYGLVTNQYVSYVHHKFNDPRWIKTIVIILFLVDTTHSAVGVYAAWNMCVANFDNPKILLVVDWTIPFTAVAVSTSGVVTQTFLIHRVFQLTKSKFLVAILGALSTGGFVSGWIAGVRSGILKDVIKFREIVPLVTCWLTLLSSVDLLITAILIIVLARSKTGFHRTDTIINRLIRGAIQTGLFASIFALGDLFSFIFAPGTTFYAMFAYPIGRIYTNTLLDTLNARMVFHRMDQESSTGGFGRWQAGTASLPFHMRTYIHQTSPPLTEGTVETPIPRAVERPRQDDKLNGHNGSPGRDSPDEPPLHGSSKV